MAELKVHKVVGSLPETLEASSLYIVRTGAGFDLHVTNESGLVVAYALNQSSGDVSGKMDKTANLSDVLSIPSARGNLGLGTAAVLNAGTAANNLLRLDSSGRIPAVNGSLLTNLQAYGLVPLGSPIKVSNVAAAALTLPGGFDQYLVRYWHAYVEGAYASIGLRLSTNSGASWQSGTGDYSYVAGTIAGSSQYVSASGANWIPIHHPNRYWKNSIYGQGAGELVISEAGTTQQTYVHGRTGYYDLGTSNPAAAQFFGKSNNLVSHNAIQFLSDNGNITIYCQLYGIREG